MNKSNLMTWPIAIAFCLSISTRAMCRDIFVNNLSGDDRRTGEQEESLSALQGPVRSIARALRAAGPSDRIVIANTGEPYRESVTLQGARHSGSEAFPFTIEGNGATLDGTAPVHPGSWRVVADHVSEWTPQHFDFHQLFIAGKLAQFRPIYSPFMLSELEPQQWTTWNGNVFFRADKDSLPLAYDLSAASLPVGITLYETRNVIVRDLVIRGYRLDAINAHDSVFGCQLQR